MKALSFSLSLMLALSAPAAEPKAETPEVTAGRQLYGQFCAASTGPAAKVASGRT